MNSNYEDLLKQALKRKEAIKAGQDPNNTPTQSIPEIINSVSAGIKARSQNKVSQSEVIDLLKQEKKEKYSPRSKPVYKQPQQFQPEQPQEQSTPPTNTQAQKLANQLLNEYYQERGEPGLEQPQHNPPTQKPPTRVVRTKKGGFIRVPVKEAEPQSYTKGSVKKNKSKRFSGSPNPPPEIPAGRSIRELQVPEHRKEMFNK